MPCLRRICSTSKTATALLTLLLAGTVPAASAAAEEGERPQKPAAPKASAARIRELQREVDGLRNDVQAIRDSLTRIEKSLASQQPVFSPVSIRIESENGQPLSGFRVELESGERGGRRAFASGRSKDDGVALSRQMPFGDYRLSVHHDSGWSATFHQVTLEVGTGLERVIIAPDPGTGATLQLAGTVNRTALSSLRFGELHIPFRSNSYSTPYSPEPGKSSDRFQTAPTLRQGISDIAVELHLRIIQDVEQPDGRLQQWVWRPDGPHLFVSANGGFTARDSRQEVVETRATGQYFTSGRSRTSDVPDVDVEEPPAEDSADESDGREPEKQKKAGQQVALLRFDGVQPAERDFSIRAVPGQLMLHVRRVLGKATPEVLESLGQPPEAEVWLEANLDRESAWHPRLFDMRKWKRNRGSSFVMQHEADIKQGATARIEVLSQAKSK